MLLLDSLSAGSEPGGEQQLHQQQPAPPHGQRAPCSPVSRPLMKRRGGLSAFYPSRSQSFSCMSDLQRNPFSQSALVVLAKRSRGGSSWSNLGDIQEGGHLSDDDACDPARSMQKKARHFAAADVAATNGIAPRGSGGGAHQPGLARQSWHSGDGVDPDASPTPCWAAGGGSDAHAALPPWAPASSHILHAVPQLIRSPSPSPSPTPSRSASPCSSDDDSGGNSSSSGDDNDGGRAGAALLMQVPGGIAVAPGGCGPGCCWCGGLPTDGLCLALRTAGLAAGHNQRQGLLGFVHVD